MFCLKNRYLDTVVDIQTYEVAEVIISQSGKVVSFMDITAEIHF
jgi:hypothetical protein